MIEIFNHGSIWLKADFHLHTKADKEFKYDQAPNDFVKLYIEQLKSTQIGIGIISNHNKFDKDEFKALYKAARKDNIFLLPGVELSVTDGSNGIHCIIVFDFESWISQNDNFIEQFLNSAFEGISNRENENTRCRYSLTDLFKKLEEHRKEYRDSFIIMAHIEQRSGFCNELDGGRIEQLANDELFKRNVLAFQKLRTRDLKIKLANWFGGEELLPAFIEGSDCKNLSEVGLESTQKNSKGTDTPKCTYVKIGDFNFEAVKYCLIDHHNRIREDEKPKILNSYIKSIHIDSSSRGLFHDTQIDFSPELNNFIGIRGSGKSAIIELIRYSIGLSLGKQAVDDDYKNGLIDYTLKSGGKLTLTIVNEDGKEFRIQKIYGQKEDIFDENNQRINSSINAVFKPVIYFGQKDLSNKNIDFEADLINKLIGNRLEDIRARINLKIFDLKEAIAAHKKLENLEELKRETLERIAFNQEKLKQYIEKGVEPKLKKQTIFDSDLQKLSDIRNTIQSFYHSLQSTMEEYKSFFEQTKPESEENKTIFDEVSKIFQQIKEEYNKIVSALLKIRTNKDHLINSESELKRKKEDLKEEFAKIKREINIPHLNPDDFLVFNRKIDTLKLKLKEIEKSEKKRGDFTAKIDSLLKEMNDLWREEFLILEKEVKKINESNNLLDIEIEFKGRKDKFLERLKQIFKGTGITENNYGKIKDVYLDFIEIYRDKNQLKTILNENHYLEFNKRFAENLNELLTYQVENKFTIKYDKKPLRDHSLGQRATALILFLLAQKDTDVLIIDQPEDDLDNQTIYKDVIKAIKSLKGNMQFIFATHNANIPVLGDSEKIIACNFEPEKINIKAGTIDNPDIQSTIVSIMEGGQEAFNKRKHIYDLWRVE